MLKVEITTWEENILQVSVPMDPPLRQVNSYILPDGEGRITVIDPGPHSPETELAWQDILQQLDMTWTGVRDVVVTHHHPDHYGLAGWLQARSGCKVWMSERAHAEAMFMWGADAGIAACIAGEYVGSPGVAGIDAGNNTDAAPGSPADPGINEVLPLFFARHGMPEEWTSGIREHLVSFIPQVSPQPEVSYIHLAELFEMGGRAWLPIVTGGHAPGHVSFYHAASGQILCGDAVLPQISPNVSLLPGSDPQPLLTFLQGLRELGSYQVSMAFPGHREPFAGFTARVDSLLRHHEERLAATEALLAGGQRSGFAVCEALFRSRISSVHQMRFAMSETLAHLAELVRRERAVAMEAEGLVQFAAVE